MGKVLRIIQSDMDSYHYIIFWNMTITEVSRTEAWINSLVPTAQTAAAHKRTYFAAMKKREAREYEVIALSYWQELQ